MNSRSFFERKLLLHVGLLALAFWGQGVAGCFRSPDPSKLKCTTAAGCPTGFVCTPNGCVPSGSVGGAGGAGGQTVPGILDGSLLDGVNADAPRVGGAGGTSRPMDAAALGGAVDGGTSMGGATGGVATGTGGAVLGGSGGVVLVGSGGSVAPDASSGTGGSTSVPDGSIRSDAADAVDAPAGFVNGTSCNTDGQCANGHCIDGVCCATACTGCQACSYAMTNQADGTCANVASGRDPHETCTDETATKPCGNDGTCDGQGACRKVGTGQKCGQASCSTDGNFTPEPNCDGKGTCKTQQQQGCAPYQCALTGCAKTCTLQTDCDAATSYCDTTLGTCAQKLSPGSTCTSATAFRCSSGACVDGRCCGSASCPTCQSCTGPGGTCVAVTNVEDPDSCTGTSICNPSGACKTKTGSPCSGGATGCLSGYCADGVCCNAACTEQCKACNTAGSPGTCTRLTSGQPVTGHSPCTNASDATCGGKCDGSMDTCAYPLSGKSCGNTPSCTTDLTTRSAFACNGSGLCATADQVCTPSGYCNSSTVTCANKLASGSCTLPVQCTSGNCCGGSCCGNSCCSGQCIDTNTSNVHCGSCSNPGCGANYQCTGGSCLLKDNQNCTLASQCASNKCSMFYFDSDGDGYPVSSNSRGFCGTVTTSPVAQYIPARSDLAWDCQDENTDVHPGQADYFTQPYQTLAGADSYDYDCNLVAEKQTLTLVMGCQLSGTSCVPITQVGQPTGPCGGQNSQAGGCTGDASTGCSFRGSIVAVACH
jgi:hypothetical protein